MYELGQPYRFTLKVYDATGALTNSSTQTVTVTLPDQTTTTASVINDSTGVYHADYTPVVQEGLYKFQGVTTGPVTSKTDYVPFNIFRSIVSIDEARVFAGYVEGDQDALFRQVMSAATEKAESIVGNCVQRRFVNDRITGYSAQVLRMPHGPLLTDTAVESVTSVYPGGPSWVTADFIQYPDSATVELLNWLPFWYGPWKATYTAGRLVIPEKIQLAVKEIIYDFWSTHRPYGLDKLEPGPEETARWETALAQYEMPPHARAMLESEEMPGFA